MLLEAHSGIRYLILLAGLSVALYALYGIVGRRPYDDTVRKLAAAFAGLLHLQVLLGLSLLIAGDFYPALTGHLMMMVFAAAVAQIIPSVMRRRPVEQRSYLPFLLGALAALGLIFGGVTAIGRTLL